MTENLGPFTNLPFYLLIQAGKEFTNWYAVDGLIRQGRLQAWLAGIVFITTYFDTFLHSLCAHKKSHFLL